MRLVATEAPETIKRNATYLRNLLWKNTIKSYHRVGWPGDSGFKNVYWRPEDGYWSIFERGKNRYWLAFGTENPAFKPKNSSLIITCEINPPFGGPTRTSAGLFATNKKGVRYLCHTGKIGGGKKGVGKKAFVRYVKRMRTAEVTWSDGVTKSVFVIGELNRTIPSKVLGFVDLVSVFKMKKRGSEIERIHRGYFNPESTRSTFYERKGRVKSGKVHAQVVNELERCLRRMGRSTENNKNIDLMLTIKGGEVESIFEVKTDNGTSSVYQGIGQLMFHSLKEKRLPRRYLVLPVGLERRSEMRLRKLDIDLIYFRKRGKKIVFHNLRAY